MMLGLSQRGVFTKDRPRTKTRGDSTSGPDEKAFSTVPRPAKFHPFLVRNTGIVLRPL
jgi:hypothetical protein